MKIIFKTLLVTILFMSFTEIESETYQVEIIQDGKIVPLFDNIANLEKKEFKIRITLNNHDGVYMSASFNRDYYNLKDEQEIENYKQLGSMTRAEKNFNEDKELAIDDKAVSYLFYDKNMDWHRFDNNIEINNNVVIGTKTIDKVSVEKTKKDIPLQKIKKNIYLFFVATEEWREDKAPKELGRKKIELRWK
jgi:hypothetical protein